MGLFSAFRWNFLPKVLYISIKVVLLSSPCFDSTISLSCSNNFSYLCNGFGTFLIRELFPKFHLIQFPFPTISFAVNYKAAAFHKSIACDDNGKRAEETGLRWDVADLMFINVLDNTSRVGITTLCGCPSDAFGPVQYQMLNHSLVHQNGLDVVANRTAIIVDNMKPHAFHGAFHTTDNVMHILAYVYAPGLVGGTVKEWFECDLKAPNLLSNVQTQSSTLRTTSSTLRNMKNEARCSSGTIQLGNKNVLVPVESCGFNDRSYKSIDIWVRVKHT